MIKSLLKNKFLTLTITSIIIGVIWRIEVEFHGWEGLIWISYSHIAVPTGLILFMIWGNLNINIAFRKRILLNIVGVLFGILMFYLIKLSLTYNFSGGLSYFFLWTLPKWKGLIYLYMYSIFILIPLLPVGTYLILNIFKQKIKIIYLILSILFIISSVPISLYLLKLTNHKGYHNLIHTIKSGIIIPFIVFSIGFLMVKIDKIANIKC